VLIKEIILAIFASATLAVGSLFALLTAGIYL